MAPKASPSSWTETVSDTHRRGVISKQTPNREGCEGGFKVFGRDGRPPLENNPEIPPSSREEGLRLLHGLATNLATSLFDNFHGLVILLDFTDKKFASDDPQAFYTEMFSTENFTGYHDPITGRTVSCPGSVRDYFNDQSNGAFKPPFDVVGPYRACYGANGETEARANQCQSMASSIFNNALKKANPDVDFSQYDNNNDGKIDMVYFLVAGYSSSYSGNNAGYLWPHASNLSWTYSSYDGKRIDRYASST